MRKRGYLAPAMELTVVDGSALLTTVSGQTEGDGVMIDWGDLGA